MAGWLLSTHQALREGLLLPLRASATAQITCCNWEVFEAKHYILPTVKFMKCWCFFSAASTKKKDVKAHVFMGVL